MVQKFRIRTGAKLDGLRTESRIFIGNEGYFTTLRNDAQEIFAARKQKGGVGVVDDMISDRYLTISMLLLRHSKLMGSLWTLRG